MANASDRAGAPLGPLEGELVARLLDALSANMAPPTTAEDAFFAISDALQPVLMQAGIGEDSTPERLAELADRVLALAVLAHRYTR